jgi:co-chaperonin GroES (HSP10)
VDINRKKILVVITPAQGEDRTRVGLFLPAAAVEKLAVQGGKVVEVGPGTPVPSPTEHAEEPWKLHEQEGKANYVPMQAKVGDYALFLRNAAVEIEFENEKYLIVPHGAILLIVRDGNKGDETADVDGNGKKQNGDDGDNKNRDDGDDPEFREEDFKI